MLCQIQMFSGFLVVLLAVLRFRHIMRERFSLKGINVVLCVKKMHVVSSADLLPHLLRSLVDAQS